MADLEIKINTSASGDGAQKAKRQLDDLKDSVKRTVPAHEEAAKAAEKHSHSHREMHAAGHALAGHLPHLSSLLWSLRSPLVAGSLAFGLIIEAIRRFNEKVEEARAAADAWDVVMKGARSFSSFAREGKESADALANNLGKFAEKAGDATKALAALNEQIKLRDQLAAEQENAEMGLELAKIGQQEALKQINPQQADVLRAQTRLKFARGGADRQVGALFEEGAQAQAKASGLFFQADQAGKSLPGKEAAVARAKAKAAEVGAANAILLGDEKTEGSFKGRLRELNEEIAQWEAHAKGSTGSWWKDIGVAMGGSPGRGFLEELQKKAPGELERLRAERGQIFRNMEGAGDRQRSADARASTLAKDLEATRDFEKTGKKQSRELFEKGAGLISEGEQRRGANARRFATEGSTLTAEADAAYVRELLQKAEEWRKQQDRVLGIAEKLLGGHQDHAQKIDRLEQRMQSLQNR